MEFGFNKTRNSCCSETARYLGRLLKVTENGTNEWNNSTFLLCLVHSTYGSEHGLLTRVLSSFSVVRCVRKKCRYIFYGRRM